MDQYGRPGLRDWIGAMGAIDATKRALTNDKLQQQQEQEHQEDRAYQQKVRQYKLNQMQQQEQNQQQMRQVKAVSDYMLNAINQNKSPTMQELKAKFPDADADTIYDGIHSAAQRHVAALQDNDQYLQAKMNQYKLRQNVLKGQLPSIKAWANAANTPEGKRVFTQRVNDLFAKGALPGSSLFEKKNGKYELVSATGQVIDIGSAKPLDVVNALKAISDDKYAKYYAMTDHEITNINAQNSLKAVRKDYNGKRYAVYLGIDKATHVWQPHVVDMTNMTEVTDPKLMKAVYLSMSPNEKQSLEKQVLGNKLTEERIKTERMRQRALSNRVTPQPKYDKRITELWKNLDVLLRPYAIGTTDANGDMVIDYNKTFTNLTKQAQKGDKHAIRVLGECEKVQGLIKNLDKQSGAQADSINIVNSPRIPVKRPNKKPISKYKPPPKLNLKDYKNINF